MAIIYVCIYNICNANKSKYDLSVYEPTYTHTYTPFVCALSHISQSIFTYILCFIASRACHMFRIYDRYEYVMCVCEGACIQKNICIRSFVFIQTIISDSLFACYCCLFVYTPAHPPFHSSSFIFTHFLFIYLAPNSEKCGNLSAFYAYQARTNVLES